MAEYGIENKKKKQGKERLTLTPTPTPTPTPFVRCDACIVPRFRERAASIASRDGSRQSGASSVKKAKGGPLASSYCPGGIIVLACPLFQFSCRSLLPLPSALRAREPTRQKLFRIPSCSDFSVAHRHALHPPRRNGGYISSSTSPGSGNPPWPAPCLPTS